MTPMRLRANNVRAMLLVFALMVAACGDRKVTIEAASQDPKPADADLKIKKVRELPPPVASAASNPEPVPLPTSGEACKGTPVRNVEALQRAVANSRTIALSAGVFELPQSLRL
ncbi:MAG: hypothetical protein AAF329_23015, partial [Cyanobacteria bacterium P01_A01_bin.17]